MWSLGLGSMQQPMLTPSTIALAKARVSGRHIFAHEGFSSRELDVSSRVREKHGGVFGHFSASGNVSIGASNAPIDVHVEMTHSIPHQVQTINLRSRAGPLKATLSIMDMSKEAERNTFKINAVSRDGPLDLTLSNGSTYGSVSIDAEATNAPAHLTLDTAFEGTFVAKTVDSNESEGASAVYAPGATYSGHMRVFRTPFQTRHIHAGAVGWGSEEAAVNGASFAEVRSVQRSAHIDI
ncbi:hypothetical protein PENSPDRAFT_433691 [Peniophora sp. CONT]|nr:hypothetical protein PENSPDRAFT_433691 [Peniophora sp. CONT]